jgi:hypothetical protein
MVRSFDLVDYKVAEAEFFLKRISKCDLDFFAARCYVSAFVSSSRSATFAIQACLKDFASFDKWYVEWQSILKNNELAKFFNEFRRVNQHIGVNPIDMGMTGPSQKSVYFFHPTPDLKEVPSEDVESACKSYFMMILELVYSCYLEFGRIIDPKMYYTEEHFAKMCKTIEDAEEEIFGISGWTKVPDCPDTYRWQILRDSQPGCGINDIFETYLGKTTPQPKRLPEISLSEDEGLYLTKKGNVWIPPDFRISDG